MHRLKRRAAVFFILTLMVSLLSGCGEEEEALSLRVCVGKSPVSLDPIYAEEICDQTIIMHLYENLMRVSVDGNGNRQVVNGVAKSVSTETNPDGTVTYTFRLNDTKWSDGSEVRAADFVYAWRRLADPASQSPFAPMLSMVVGYDEAREAGNMELLQVRAKNDTTLTVTLDGYYEWFLSEICTSPATVPLRRTVVQELKEAAEDQNAMMQEAGTVSILRWWSDPTALVTNGPYQVSEVSKTEMVLGIGEEHAGSGPEELVFRFASSASEAERLYNNGEVDAVWPLTAEYIAQLAAQEDPCVATELATYSVLVNTGRDLFADSAIRKAVRLVVDVSAVAEVSGAAAVAAEGLIPPGVPGNGEVDFRSEQGKSGAYEYEAACEEAKTVLENAGYDSGARWGELKYLYKASGPNAAVAELLCGMWSDALRMKVTPVGVSEKELWAALRSGEYDLAGVCLTTFGNDAECFLRQWTSGNPDNVIAYESPAYDTLMSVIVTAEDSVARIGCLHDAESLLLEDNAVIPLYTNLTAWKLGDAFTGACRDARGWFNFANVVRRPS